MVKKLKRGVKFGREKKPLPEDFDLWYPRWRRRETTFTWTAGFSRRTYHRIPFCFFHHHRPESAFWWNCSGKADPEFARRTNQGKRGELSEAENKMVKNIVFAVSAKSYFKYFFYCGMRAGVFSCKFQHFNTAL